MAAGWSTEETRTFLGIWGAAQLDKIVRNQAIYEKIPAEIRDAGYEHACSELQRKLALPASLYVHTYYDPCVLSASHGA